MTRIEETNLSETRIPKTKQDPIFTTITPQVPFIHQEYGFNDFKRQPLLLEMPSYVGPTMAAADLNADGMEETNCMALSTQGFPFFVTLTTDRSTTSTDVTVSAIQPLSVNTVYRMVLLPAVVKRKL